LAQTASPHCATIVIRGAWIGLLAGEESARSPNQFCRVGAVGVNRDGVQRWPLSRTAGPFFTRLTLPRACARRIKTMEEKTKQRLTVKKRGMMGMGGVWVEF
jgi:hypothetical protein